LLGLPYRDTWYISPGNSFASRLIADAGGEYLWHDVNSDMSMPMSLENVFSRAINADFWLNTGTVAGLDEIMNLDNRFGRLQCVSRGNIYNFNRRISRGGGNDYWESGTLHPSVVLKDIAAILHPGIFGQYQPVYYSKVN
jgi:iron complex transport system substrate-binding protein